MTAAEMRELAERLADENLGLIAGDLAQSAAIIRWAAKVLEAEPVIFGAINDNGQCSACVKTPSPTMDGSSTRGLRPLIIKPTFDGNDR